MPTTEADRRKTREKVKAHRERQRAEGLRLKQFWVPDVRSAAFAEEAHRQSLAIAQSSGEADDQAFIDAAIDWDSLPAWNGEQEAEGESKP